MAMLKHYILIVLALAGSPAATNSQEPVKIKELPSIPEPDPDRVDCKIAVIGAHRISRGEALKVQVRFETGTRLGRTLFNPWLSEHTMQPGVLAVFDESDTYRGNLLDLLETTLGFSNIPSARHWVEIPSDSATLRTLMLSPASGREPTIGQPNRFSLPPGKYRVQLVCNERLTFDPPPTPGKGTERADHQKYFLTGIKRWDILRSNVVEFEILTEPENR
jgi:hypothetical protein